MYTNTYSDLTRDAKLLKKLLKEHESPLQLSACQEIIAKLYRFSSFHEAQRVLSVQHTQIAKPIYNIDVNELRTSMHRNSRNNMWEGRILSLLDCVIDGFYKTSPITTPEHIIEHAALDMLEQIKDNPNVSRYLDALPGYRSNNEDARETAMKQHAFVTMQISYALSPYLRTFSDFKRYDQTKIPRIVLSSGPGSGKTMWSICMALNWLYRNPGGKLIILDVGTSWSGFTQYLNHTERHLKITDILSKDILDISRQFDKNLFNSSDVIRIAIDCPHNAVTALYSQWEALLQSIDSNTRNTLLIFDEYHRRASDKNSFPTYVLKDNYTYVYVTQWVDPLSNLPETVYLDTFLTAADKRKVWQLSSSADDILLKHMLIMNVGYEKAISLLVQHYPNGTIQNVFGEKPVTSVQIVELANSILASQKSG